MPTETPTEQNPKRDVAKSLPTAATPIESPAASAARSSGVAVEPAHHRVTEPVTKPVTASAPEPVTETPAAEQPDATTKIGDSAPDAESDGDSTPEQVQPEQVQPSLDLATNSADPLLTARTESGALIVRIGDTSLGMRSALESLLFVADAPVEAAQLARVVNTPVTVVEAYLRELDEEYRTQERGLRVAERSGRFQMVTTPAAAQLIETFLNLDMTTKLSAPALETLAIVAYRQPVTRAQVEAVRGVDCSGILRSLLQRGLIEEVDRLDAPGRPVLYGVTDLFMHHFGLTSLQELPPLQTVEAEQLDSAVEQ
ncbi:MAG: SMC-Scp complex subunit ScpB [Caldilineaceae bacterium]|nr:SMC-Scp complex subunit ScpB [Caldilineaceae bacterium]